jgi:inhibitor of cysteine peptidase
MGAVFDVRLQETPTTGFSWSVEAAHGLELLEDSFETGGPAIGAAGVRVLRFRAARPGSLELRIKHWREWEGEASVTDRFDARIIVR